MNLSPCSRWVLALMALGACSATTWAATTTSDFWVYFGTYTDAKSKGIYVSHMDKDGRLSPAELATSAQNPAFLAVDPRHRFLFAANETNEFRGRETGAVTAYAINADSGRLTRLNQVSSMGSGPAHVSIDGTGRTVLVANYGGGNEAAFRIGVDGSLGTAVSFIQNHGASVNPARQGEPHAHCFVADPSNQWALLCDLGLDHILVFHLDSATAKLTPNDPAFGAVKPGSGPRHIAFRPDGKFAYVINEMACTLTTFAFDGSRGTLREIDTVSTLPTGESVKSNYSGAEVSVHPSGHFVYTSNRGHNSIAVFRIDDATGQVALVEHAPSGGNIPRSFGIDPTGHYLVAANQESASVVVFAIDPNSGALTPTGDAVNVPKPVSVVFVPAPPKRNEK